jgi:hypothetical protein
MNAPEKFFPPAIRSVPDARRIAINREASTEAGASG